MADDHKCHWTRSKYVYRTITHQVWATDAYNTHIYNHQMGQSVEDFSMQVLEPTEHLWILHGVSNPIAPSIDKHKHTLLTRSYTHQWIIPTSDRAHTAAVNAMWFLPHILVPRKPQDSLQSVSLSSCVPHTTFTKAFTPLMWCLT